MDLHADQIQGFFEKPVDHLYASSIFVPYIKSLNINNLTIASPDMGGSKRAYAYSKFLDADVVICYKQRSKGNVNIQRYNDGEFQPSFEESVRGSRVFIIGSTNPSSDNLMEMLLMLDAAKRSSARHITAVIPYFGWARQDRKDKPRVPILSLIHI